jgi:peroxiredoxin
VLLAALGIAALQFWFSLHLLRQNGRLMLRLDALESKLGQPAAEVPRPGLPVNSAAPDFLLTAMDGETVTLAALSEIGKPLVLVFSEPDCSMCDLLLPELAKWQREFRDRIWIGLISRGGVEANRAKTKQARVENLLLQKDREVASAYRVEGTPSAVLVTGGLIASPLAEGADAIRELVSRATLPAPVSKGDAVPSLRLADLAGKTLDLATLRGRRTMLLFWNPACGFCQQMLSDVKAWERDPPPGAPELVIISAGSFDANREQGFRSRVLLDPYFAAGYVFRSGGTPSALVIDEDGTVASEVGVGAQEVFALGGAGQTVNGAAGRA